MVFSENLRVVDEEFCLAPPISLAYVAAILERSGHQVILIDAHALGLSKEQVLERVIEFKPRLLGFRVDTYQFHQTLEWIRFLKQHTGISVMIGGINLSLYPEESLNHAEIDYGIIGEAIEALPRFAQALEKGLDFSQIEGVAYKADGKITINPPLKKPVDFDSYPFPSRHLLPNDRYYSFVSQRKNFTVMVTSKGCPYKCVFCAIANLPYSERSPENVVDEIEQCYKYHNVREIDFFDAVFFLNRDRAIKICKEMLRRKIDIEWSCRSRVDLVDEELLKTASRAGCRKIYYGIESADPEVLSAINKRVTLSQIKSAIECSRKNGISTLGFFMLGSPHDDLDSVRRTIGLMRELNLDFVQVCRTIAKPGTALDEMVKGKTGRDFWREYIAGETAPRQIEAPWTELGRKETEWQVKKAYISFYLRPKYIFMRLSKTKSPGEIYRYIKVGIKMLVFLFVSDAAGKRKPQYIGKPKAQRPSGLTRA